MLEELRIQDFAIIDSLAIGFGAGLNVLTGETGAGKSIVIDALGFVLGARASASLVRHGSRQARVEATFSVQDLPGAPVGDPPDGDPGDPAQAAGDPGEPPGPAGDPSGTAPGDPPPGDSGDPGGAGPGAMLGGILEQARVPVEGPDLVLCREITAGGRNTWRINGSPVTQAVVRDVGALLLEIHGQHDSQGLMQASRHIDLLDRLGGADLQAVRAEHARAYRAFRALRAERDRLVAEERDRERRKEWLSFEVEEIESARLVVEPDEVETLEADRQVLANADRIRGRLADAAGFLDEGEGGRGQGARDLLSRAVRSLAQVVPLDPRAHALAEAAENAQVAVDELYHDLMGHLEQVEADPYKLDQVQERLNLIGRLQRKYGTTVAEIVAYGQRARAELTRLEGSQERLEAIGLELEQTSRDMGVRVADLSRRRRQVAAGLERRVAEELEGLEMKGTRFEVRFDLEAAEDGLEVPDLPEAPVRVAVGPGGVDRVEFLISANPGQPVGPLARIASGGELSRVMLAIQSVLAGIDPVGTMVFDEVDAGLGGVAAEAVASRLQRISESRQVLCVTHLPLVAAAATAHWSLAKEVREGQTRTHARRLDSKERAGEIARMLAGRQASQTTLRQAQEMLQTRRRAPNDAEPRPSPARP